MTTLNLSPEFVLNLEADRWRTGGMRGYVAGMSGSGKSNLMAVLAEELYGIGVPWLIIDPEGDYRSLTELGERVQVCGSEEGDAIGHPSPNSYEWVPQILAALAAGQSVVVDLSGIFGKDGKRQSYVWLLSDLLRQQRRSRQPMFLLVEEAHIFAPQKRQQDMASLEMTVEVARQGRRAGINSFFSSQRPRDLEADMASQCNIHFCGKIEFKLDYEAVRHLLELPPQTANGNGKKLPPPPKVGGTRLHQSPGFYELTKLAAGEFYVRLGGQLHRVNIRARRTTHLGATPVIQGRLF